MITAHMKNILVRIRTIRRMTIQTLIRCARILEEFRFFKVTQVSLIKTHLTVHLIAGRYATIGDAPLFQRIFTHIDLEVAILRPLTVFFSTDGKNELSALVLRQ